MRAEKSIPTIHLWHLLLVPLQGDLSDAQAERLAVEVLAKIRDSDARGLVIDVTGLWIMDSHLCSLISQLAAAAALMGATTVMCGLSPEIATTLQTMGLSLPGVRTERSLEDALARLGIGPVEEADRERDADADERSTVPRMLSEVAAMAKRSESE
ncbi:MAG: STAS domain-containing protein [Myxococcota bacterium]